MSDTVTTGQKFRDSARRLYAAADSTGEGIVDELAGAKVRYQCEFPAETTAGTNHARNFGFGAPVRFKATAVRIRPSAALTANGTNFKTFNLKYDDGAGGSVTTVATVDTSAVSWTAHVPVLLAITAANAVIPAGSQLRADHVASGTGVATPEMVFEVVGEVV
jgi:hypothetical protein